MGLEFWVRGLINVTTSQCSCTVAWKKLLQYFWSPPKVEVARAKGMLQLFNRKVCWNERVIALGY